MLDPETTGSLMRIRASTVIKHPNAEEPTTYGLEGDRSYAEGVLNATGQLPALVTREYPVLPVPTTLAEQTPDTTQDTPEPLGSTPTLSPTGTRLDVPRHRRIEKVNPRRRAIAALAAGSITTGASILYSQHHHLPRVYEQIVNILQ